MTPDMEALVERLTKAARPDRELDAALLNFANHRTRLDKKVWQWRRHGKGDWLSMPSPTSSFEAAMLLVPKRHLCFVTTTLIPSKDNPADVTVSLDVVKKYSWGTKASGVFGRGEAKNLPRALCIAALRARSASRGTV